MQPLSRNWCPGTASRFWCGCRSVACLAIARGQRLLVTGDCGPRSTSGAGGYLRRGFVETFAQRRAMVAWLVCGAVARERISHGVRLARLERASGRRDLDQRTGIGWYAVADSLQSAIARSGVWSVPADASQRTGGGRGAARDLRQIGRASCRERG